MQNTRLTNLLGQTAESLGGWLRNPWRRLSVLIIALLGGNFLATVISTVAGQAAQLDIYVAGLLVITTELISRLTYQSQSTIARSLLVQIPNAIKLGLIYGLFVEAFKLGS